MSKLLLALAFLAAYLPGCDCITEPPADWVRVADCTTGPAWHIGDELICDDFRQTSFASRMWMMNDNANSACVFCEGNAP